MPLPTRAPERIDHPIAVRDLVLWKMRADGSFSTADIASSPRLRAAASPLSLTEQIPGSIVIGDDGAIYRAGSDGVPAVQPGLGDAAAWTALQTFRNIAIGAKSTLTIASGAVAQTRSYHQIDTEGAAASDDLDSITGGVDGELLLVSLVAAARNVVLKHAVGANLISCPAGQDITLDVLTDWALLVHNGSQWTVLDYSTIASGGGGLGKALASVAASVGASLVGIQDSGALITGTTVEAALAELAARVGGNDTFVKAVIAVADAPGGLTDALLTLQLYRQDGTTPIASARQAMIRATAAQFSGSADSSPTLGTVTAGSIVASLSGLWVVETNAAGLFACTVTNATDEALYFVGISADNGCSDLAKSCIVVGCVPDLATWSP